jgi:hypothetical protein
VKKSFFYEGINVLASSSFAQFFVFDLIALDTNGVLEAFGLNSRFCLLGI